jgi:flavin reductase (DIM6/NTAB) family NADH-FMN oxidoreductase RutF
MTLGLLTETKTAENLERYRECVVNIPGPELWEHVEKLAPLTGKNPVPELKKKQFRYEPRKFEVAELTPMPSEIVKPCEWRNAQRISKRESQRCTSCTATN